MVKSACIGFRDNVSSGKCCPVIVCIVVILLQILIFILVLLIYLFVFNVLYLGIMSFVVLNSQALSWTEMEKILVDRLTRNYPDIEKLPCKFQVS